MQQLLVDFITSLDGYGAAEGWPGWWGLEGPEYLTWLEHQSDDYTILMGATTYRLMSELARGGEPGTDVLDGYPDVALDHVESRTFDGRIQLLEYIPRVLSGPPGTPNPNVSASGPGVGAGH